MSNPIFDMLGSSSQVGDSLQLINQFIQFKNSFRGNPQEEVQRLLNSGKISQAQYNDAVQKAQQLRVMLYK